MKDINCNVSGNPTDTPRILDDTGRSWSGVFNTGNRRITFSLPNDATGGGHLRWLNQNVNFLIPASPGAYEGASLGLPTIAYPSVSALTIQGNQFISAGEVWLWRGTTEMLAPWRMLRRENVRPILQQRRDTGATIVRSLAMGWPFITGSGRPSDFPDYWPVMRAYWTLLAEIGLNGEWVVFAGTRQWMPDPREQQAFYTRTCEELRAFPHMTLELLNEDGHSTQSINPQNFGKPAGIVASHGSGLTDAPPVSPFWDYVTFHARRDRPPDSRGITNVDPYTFQSDFPKPCPFVCDENMKPEDYGFNREVARQMGRHGAMGWGATFHSQEGVESRPWSEPVRACAEAFFEGVVQ